MTFLSVRRLIPVCVVVVAALAAAIAPGSASAASDLGEQCSGASPIKGHGSTFQAPILEKWAAEFSTSGNSLACAGKAGQGDEKVVKVEYLSTGSNAGSGACLHGWGAESEEPVKYGEFGFCGTDEAPNPTQKSEIETHKKGGQTKSLEEIPVLQGAVAVIVHLPKGCLAESEIEKSGTKYKLGRLVLDDSSIDKVYMGEVKTWKELLANQEAEGGAGSDKLTCKGGTAEEEERITPVVRLDHSGTTHIFKSFLEQVDDNPVAMEAYAEEIGGKKTGCGAAKGVETEPMSEVSEACQNQRWPKAAEILRGEISGNPGVVQQVNKTESSIGYADLAVARKEGFFSKKGVGGENKKGTATKVGEQHAEFWAEVQDTATPSVSGYADPASNGDVEKAANSNCLGTVYTNEAGKKFPPANTREPWNGAKAELVQKEYAICGLTYDLALRQYKYYPGTTKEEATSVENFLLWALNTKSEGGGSLEKGTDYEKLPGSVITKGEKGVKEIGFEKAG
jgi:ABC-type phosphate transport system substrate-binding protein